jgi:hypothetical protein
VWEVAVFVLNVLAFILVGFQLKSIMARVAGTTGARYAVGNADAAVVRAATEAQRQRLVALRADGTIGDAAFQRVEEELDWARLLRAG